mgnify:CR=1 FL=1
MQTDLVIVSEYCQKCHIDPSFIILLEEGGLIDINITDGERYLFSSQLRDLEQYTRMSVSYTHLTLPTKLEV